MAFKGESGHCFTNWAKTLKCHPELYFEPRTISDLKQVLHKARADGKKLKVVGFGHSPADIALTGEYMVTLKHLNSIIEVDSKTMVATVQSGILLKDLNPYLDKHGLALENLPAVDEVSIGGLLSTGSHNSGIEFGIMATQVLQFELLTADGEIVTYSKDRDVEAFNLAVVGLGALGIILTVKIQCIPSFYLSQIEEPCSLQESLDHLEENLSKSEYFKLLYLPHVDRCINVHIKKTTHQEPSRCSSWFWDNLIGFHLYQIILWICSFFPNLLPTVNKCYYWLMMRGGKKECDKSYKILHFNCMYKQHVMEWCVAREDLPKMLNGLRQKIKEKKINVHLPVEIRFGKADNIALSPCYQRNTCFMNALMFRPFCRDQPGRDDYFSSYADVAMSLNGRPHWAKASKISRVDATYLSKVYPKFQEFLTLRKRLDPSGLFDNNYLQRVIGQ